MKTIFEQQGVEYHQLGDYMFPDVEQEALTRKAMQKLK